jgi:hypothetical protein
MTKAKKWWTIERSERRKKYRPFNDDIYMVKSIPLGLVDNANKLLKATARKYRLVEHTETRRIVK